MNSRNPSPPPVPLTPEALQTVCRDGAIDTVRARSIYPYITRCDADLQGRNTGWTPASRQAVVATRGDCVLSALHQDVEHLAIERCRVRSILLRISPIRVRWRREEEFGFEPVGPAMVVKVRALLDRAGRPADWRAEIWSGTHSNQPWQCADSVSASRPKGFDAALQGG
jgi:hypothetical protein